jgi:hypothetical protein
MGVAEIGASGSNRPYDDRGSGGRAAPAGQPEPRRNWPNGFGLLPAETAGNLILGIC